MQKRLSNITVLIILYNTVLNFWPLIIIIIPVTDKKILHSRIHLHFHRLNMVYHQMTYNLQLLQQMCFSQQRKNGERSTFNFLTKSLTDCSAMSFFKQK